MYLHTIYLEGRRRKKKGVIVLALKEMVIEKFGIAKWKKDRKEMKKTKK